MSCQSDSSEDEDLSRFKDAVDDSFMKYLINSNNGTEVKEKPKSERYLDEASHYNDVKVPDEMQRRIGAKISAIIEKKIEFVAVENNEHNIAPEEVNGGVKLFSDSTHFLSCDGAKDTYTKDHNIASKKMKRNNRKILEDDEVLNEEDKVKAAAISVEYLLSKEETKSWKSRRKEKLFQYKSTKKSKVLTLIE